MPIVVIIKAKIYLSELTRKNPLFLRYRFMNYEYYSAVITPYIHDCSIIAVVWTTDSDGAVLILYLAES